MVSAHELGIVNQIEKLPSAAHPIKRDERIADVNPLAKVPAALTPEGGYLFDSRVICEYLDRLAGPRLFPASAEQRWRALSCQALGDGILDAAVLVRYELVVRPPNYQWPAWREAQVAKVDAALARLESMIDEWADPMTIGTITIGCALGYLDFRFPDHAWRGNCQGITSWFATFSTRPSMVATLPRESA